MITLAINSLKERTGLSHYSNALVKEFVKLKYPFKIIETKKHSLLLKEFFNYLGFDGKNAFNNYPVHIPLNSSTHLTNQQQCIPLNYLKCKTIVTVHDIYPFATGNYNSFFEKKLNNLSMNGLVKANHFIADSHFTKSELVKHLHINENKITVVHLGVDLKEFKPLNIKRENTILYIGGEAPRKNFRTLLQAFAIVQKKIKYVKLVKIGNPQSALFRKQTIELIEKLNIKNSVFFKDYIFDLNTELNKAGVLVFPSLYEGFGLPILEAMASGCPVVCSNASSLPEIGKDAVEYFNPYDNNELAEKLIKVLTNNSLRKKMVKRGLNIAKKMTWKKTAKETIKAYKNFLY